MAYESDHDAYCNDVVLVLAYIILYSYLDIDVYIVQVC